MKTDSSNHLGIPSLPTTHTTLSDILLSRLIPYVDEITGDHQCGFLCNRSATDHILCIHEELAGKMEIQWGNTSTIYGHWERLWFN